MIYLKQSHIKIALLGFLVLFACTKKEVIKPQHEHLEYFGFTIIDTYWDDPTDTEIKTNYADEVAPFSNLADILVVNPDDDIRERIEYLNEKDMKAILHLNDLFFEMVDSNSPSGTNYDLRPDYEDRWNQFKNLNQSMLTDSRIGTFYIGEEPTWNGVSFDEMNAVSSIIQSDFDQIPTMLIEASSALEDLQVPSSIDWIGFDHYFIKNPMTNEAYQQEWALLKNKVSSSSQRTVVIMDSHYIDWAHGEFGNISLSEMGMVADNYYQLATSDEQVICLLGYFWPNGFDDQSSIGARGMPEDIKNKYIEIGKEITKK